MANLDSFKKASENTARIARFKGATKKLNSVNFALEFQKRGIDTGNSDLEN